MRTVTTEPIIVVDQVVNDREISIAVHRELGRQLSWVAGVTFRSHWKGEGAMTWEVSAMSAEALVGVLLLFDLRPLMAGIHVAPGDAAPPAMEVRREQLRLAWAGLVGRAEKGMA